MDRPARRRGSRTTSAFRRGSRATSWRHAPFTRPADWAPRFSLPARSPASIRNVESFQLDSGEILRARTIVLACGVSWRHLSIEGFDRLAGKGISYGAARSEASNTHGLDVHIVGAGNSAGQAALFFANHARSVTILCRGDNLEKGIVALSDRPARDPVEYHDDLRNADRGRSRRGVAGGDRDRGHDQRKRRNDSTQAASSSSSAPTQTRRGCRPKSHSMRRAMC